jgi:cytoskeletal protein RodZ
MSGFGDRLRELRESREIALDEIAESTKISKRYLQALERNEFEELPGGVFAKGYIRTYAEYLGVNPEPLLEAYAQELQSRGEGDPAEDEKAAQKAAHAALSKLAGTPPGEPRVGIGPGARYFVLGLVGIGVVAVLVWVLLGVLGTEPGESTVAAAATEPAPEPSVTTDRTPLRPEPERVAQRVAELPPPGQEPEPVVEHHTEPPPPQQEPEPVTQPVTERTATAEFPTTPPREEPIEETVAPSRLAVSEFGVGTDVINRQLVGQSDRFATGTRVVFWTRVLGGRRGDTIRHVWIREGRPIGTIELNVGASHWRTQSRWTVRQGAGQWAVEARDAQDQVLARAEFACVAAD